jgi:hypothetical protein
MKKGIIWILAFGMLFALPAPGFSASFKVYPGAKLDAVYEARQPEPGSKILKASKEIVFTTSDPFESVIAFYSGIAREYKIPGRTGRVVKLFSGQELKEAYFIFDNAADIMTSKHWIKIQRPYLGKDQAKEASGKYGTKREVTAIIEEDKRTYP